MSLRDWPSFFFLLAQKLSIFRRPGVDANRRRLLRDKVLLDIPGSLCHIFGTAKIAPIIFIGAKGKDFFSPRCETQV